MTLPPLPELSYLGDDVSYGYDAQDMRDYATAAVQAALSKCGGANCMGSRLDGNTNWVTEDALKAAVLAEREAIAQMFDGWHAEERLRHNYWAFAAREIRARKEQA